MQTYSIKWKYPTTKEELFFTKVAPAQSITEIVLLGFWLIMLPGMFISSYTITYFFVNNFFSECLYFSEYVIRMFLLVFWLRNKQAIKYVRNWRNGGGHQKCVQVRTGGEGYHASCVSTLLNCLGSCFCFMVPCFMCIEIQTYLYSKRVCLLEMAVFLQWDQYLL